MVLEVHTLKLMSINILAREKLYFHVQQWQETNKLKFINHTGNKIILQSLLSLQEIGWKLKLVEPMPAQNFAEMSASFNLLCTFLLESTLCI